MSKINKYENIIVDFYTNDCVEGDRFGENAQNLEFLTTMKYIRKYAKRGARILEVGAGTGAYSIALAKLGYSVTAVELVESNLNVMIENSKEIDNITCLQGDALDLSRFEENAFDIVLNFGPMYHLYSAKDKNQAIIESIRVCKLNGICMFAYLTHSSMVWAYGVRKNKMTDLAKLLKKAGKIIDTPEEVFATYYIEDFHKQFSKTNTEYISNVATDGIAPLMKDYINGVMTDSDFDRLVDWHFSTCERADQQGLSSHLLYICRKVKRKK